MICTPWYFRQAVFHILCGTITVKHDPLDHEKVQRLILSGDFMSVADALFSKHVECHFVPLKGKSSGQTITSQNQFVNIVLQRRFLKYQGI